MRHSSSETRLHSIARDAAVKAEGMRDPTTTHARLGDALQRMYAPVDEGQSDRFDYLLMQLDRRLSS
jgi:hypothetical protein